MGPWKEGDRVTAMATTNEEKQVKKHSEEPWAVFSFLRLEQDKRDLNGIRMGFFLK